MLTAPGEVSMSSSMTSGPHARDRRRARHLCFWLLMAISSVRTQGPPTGLPGVPGRRPPRLTRCPECAKLKQKRWAVRNSDGWYECGKGHRFPSPRRALSGTTRAKNWQGTGKEEKMRDKRSRLMTV
jgi:hypothetical protein